MRKTNEEIEESQVGVVLPVSVTLGFSQPILHQTYKIQRHESDVCKFLIRNDKGGERAVAPLH